MASRGDINITEVQPILRNEWLKIKIDETIEKSGAFTKLKSKDFFNQGKYPVVDQGDKFISGYVNEESLLYQGELPVIIFGDHTRNIKFVDFPFAAGADGTKILKPKAFYNPKFYHYYFKSLNVPNLGYSRHFSILKELEFPLPPLPEQHRIVAKLDTLFSQLETIKTSMANIPLLLKDFRQQVLTQAVTGKLTEEWRKGKELENGEDFIKRVIKLRKEKILKKLPGLEFKKVNYPFQVDDTWTFGLLQNFGEFTRGKSKHRPRNDDRLFGGDFPFIQTGEVSRSNGIITEYKNTYSEFGLSQSRLFPKGTLCITIAANIAETGILDFDACFPDSVVGYLPFENYYSSKFAMFYFNTIQKDLEHYAPATAQKNINLGILFEVPFPVPPFDEQQEIVSRVESLFAKTDAIEQQYRTLKASIDTLPQALLRKAFKGELTEQLESDGDAMELLKEIKTLKNISSTLIKKNKGTSTEKKGKIDNKKQLIDNIKKILKEKADGISYKELLANFYDNSQDLFINDIIQELLINNIISQEFSAERKQMLIKINQ